MLIIVPRISGEAKECKVGSKLKMTRRVLLLGTLSNMIKVMSMYVHYRTMMIQTTKRTKDLVEVVMAIL